MVEIPPALWLPIIQASSCATRPAKIRRQVRQHLAPRRLTLPTGRSSRPHRCAAGSAKRAATALVRPIMRYGNPSIASQLDALKAEGATRILILPLYRSTRHHHRQRV